MPGDSDARVIANAQRQAELEKRHRDLTKPVPPIGTDGDSLRSVKGFENVSDEMLAERANFSLREHMKTQHPTVMVSKHTLDLQGMTTEELHGLTSAALTELETRQKMEQP